MDISTDQTIEAVERLIEQMLEGGSMDIQIKRCFM
jgi:molybdopterin biosynthesis enzyme MoaB